MRRTASVVALTLAIAACSGGDDPAPNPSATTTPPATTIAPETVSDAGEARPSTTAPAEPVVWTVSIDVSVDGFESAPSVEAVTSLTFDPDDPGDPFGVSASCSGSRDEVAAYSVFVSGGTEIDYVGLWTSDPMVSSGIYDVQIRVEHAGSTYDAFGTMTLATDLRSAEFVGFGRTGGEISGAFRCDGGDEPSPLMLGDDDGTLESIDVFALLRRDTAIRVVGLATTELVLADCPAATSGAETSETALEVRGGAPIGSISSFAVTSDRVTMRVGSVDYELDVVDRSESGGAGTVSAIGSDGTNLDAAYRCT